MENIKAISDEAVNGITEIELGSREILSSVVHVDEISVKSRERVAELESAMAGFKIDSDCEDNGVAVKEAPRSVTGAEARKGSVGAALHKGDLSAEARIVD